MESNADKGILITKKIESKVLISVLVIKRSKRTDTGDYVCRTSDGQVAHKKVQVLNGRYFYFTNEFKSKLETLEYLELIMTIPIYNNLHWKFK